WKFRRYLVADGNFVLNHPIKNQGEEEPVWLTDGAAYMVERSLYAEHLEETREYQEPPTCYEHRVVADKNKAKKGYDSTGIVAIACARHGCFAPGSVVDMQKGERQTNVDYALCHAIANTSAKKTTGALLAYDINCQYCVNFRTRIARSPELSALFPPTLSISFVIGLFHVHGHKDECLSRFAPTYFPGSGVTSGEILESLWSTLNGAANVTRSMTLAHRSEMLDACMADSNWRKLQGMVANGKIVAFLIKQIKKARKSLAKAEESFGLLDATATPHQRETWTEAMDDANADRDNTHNDSMDVYNVRIKKVMPHKEVQIQLMTEENAEKTQIGIADWVASAIELQEDQYVPQEINGRRKKSKKLIRDDIALARGSQKILVNMNQFYERADLLFPKLKLRTWNTEKWEDKKEECVCEGDEDDVCFCDEEQEERAESTRWAEAEDELSPIPLPSGLDEIPEGWESVVEKETVFRVTQANEALESIRSQVAHKSYLYRANRGLAVAKRERTRGYDAIKAVDAKLRFNMKRYHLARWALDRLGCLEQHPEFQPLTRSHTKAVTTIYDPNMPDQKNDEPSWIWTVVLGVDTTSDSYVEEVYRVNWIRAKSRRDRWAEELVMIGAEMDWFTRWHMHRANEAAEWAELGLGDGHTAYALRQADMWR
ncbi:hypothetical protein DFP72DRAFT_757635, partial [Ephemerocybe angulata]